MTLRHAAALLAAALLSVPAAAPTSAQTWRATAGHHVETFRADRPAWHETRATVQRLGPSGAFGAELARISRNDRADVTVAADLYRVLSRRVYANVRAEAAPGARVVPTLNLLGEVYAGVGRGWDVSAGGRYLAVPGTDVPLVTASAMHTAGPIVLGGRTTVALAPGVTVSAVATARYAPETSGPGVPTRLSLVAGQGQEAVVTDAGDVVVRRQRVVALYGQRRIGGPVGLSAGAGYTADGTLTRWSAEAGLVVQF